MGKNGTMRTNFPIPNIWIGQGRYIAYAEWFACLDYREAKWRLSRVRINQDNSLTFIYVGEFDTEADITRYIDAEARA